MEKTKTNAMVYFTIFGEDFPIDTVSDLLKLKPTLSYKRGEEIIRQPNPHVTFTGTMYRKNTAWNIGTEFEETIDLEVQINKVINQMKSNEEIIKEICRTYNLKCHFMIVLKINEGNTPAVTINHEFIRLANNIGAEIEFDLYANPYD